MPSVVEQPVPSTGINEAEVAKVIAKATLSVPENRGSKAKKDERALHYEIVLRQFRPLLNNLCLQRELIKLVASKEEAEVAEVTAKATLPVPVNQGSFTARMHKAPYKRLGSNLRPRERKCWVCGKAGHIWCSCLDKH